jgi:hypothetical protein
VKINADLEVLIKPNYKEDANDPKPEKEFFY